MSLITKEVEVILNGSNAKRYEALGYIIPRIKNKWYRYTVPVGASIIVKTKDLPNGSNVKVDVSCDGCGKKLNPVEWYGYMKRIHKDGTYYCLQCACELFGAENSRKSIRKKGLSLQDWCLKNDRQDVLGRWDYILNECSPAEINYTSQGINGKGYWFKCLDHPEHGSELKNVGKLASHAQKNIDCSQCNCITLTNPELVKYFVNIEDTKKYSAHSRTIVDFKCPNCGFIKPMEISRFTVQGFSCNRCSDGISYPEKIMHSVLEQLNIEFITQLSKTTFKWCKSYKYDFYITNIGIVETNGMQHYVEPTGSSKFTHTLREEQDNDKTKKQLAKYNGIKNYIIIDCRISKLEFIKNSILNSELAKLFDLSNINWLKCEKSACKSLVKTTCNLWNSGMNSTIKISNELKMSIGTITRYLKQGAKLGWCNYNAKEASLLNYKNRCVSVICLNTKKVFNKVINGAKMYNLAGSNISNCCKGKSSYAGKLADGTKLHWMYYEDYLKQNNTSLKEAI